MNADLPEGAWDSLQHRVSVSGSVVSHSTYAAMVEVVCSVTLLKGASAFSWAVSDFLDPNIKDAAIQVIFASSEQS